jgi:hypothetical protein
MRVYFFVISLVLSYCVGCNSKEIIVGQNTGGWSVGAEYVPINAVVGDQLVRRI